MSHKEERAARWKALVEDYRSSGDRVATWCERHQVTEHQLYYWMRKLKKAEQQPPAGGQKWVALAVDETRDDQTSGVRLTVGAVVVDVRPGFDPTVLAAVVRTLRSLC